MFKSLSDSILSVIYPQGCRVCNGEVESSEDGIACTQCWESTRIFKGSETLCMKCGAFLFESSQSQATFCGKCDEHSYDRAFSLGIYEKAMSATVLQLKKAPHLPGRIRRLLANSHSRFQLDDSSVIIPVPLSPGRFRERGFNQAAVIGRDVSERFGLPFDAASLIRTVHTPMHRAGMDKKARARTVKNAFEVVRPKLVEGRRVLLVDDILTSGATASICAEVLKNSGASIVNVLTLARAA